MNYIIIGVFYILFYLRIIYNIKQAIEVPDNIDID